MPGITFCNTAALHDVENQKILRPLKSFAYVYKHLKRQFYKQPLESFLTLLAAVAESLMVTNSIFDLLGEHSANQWYCSLMAISFGILYGLQFILLEGQALSIRTREGLIDNSENSAELLASKHNCFQRIPSHLLVHSIPIIGALLYTALAFIESRELIERIAPSSDADYREDMGDILGIVLAMVYGGMQYTLSVTELKKPL